MKIESAKQLTVYKRAFDLSMLVFQMTRRFPSEEKYALVSQMLRSSRSVCLNLREAWAKRRYPAHFVSKLSDCDGENSETDSALDFALSCGYTDEAEHRSLASMCDEVGRMLGSMMAHPEKFCPDQRADNDRHRSSGSTLTSDF